MAVKADRTVAWSDTEFLSDNHDAGKKLAGVNRENAEKLFGPGVKW